MIDTNKVVRLIDIADIAGVGPSAVSNWRVRSLDFPDPVAVLGTSNYGHRMELFDLGQVIDWLESTGRLP